MDLSALRGAVRTRTGFPSGDSLITDAVLTDLVNSALQDFSAEDDWPWLEDTQSITTVADTRTYALAADAYEVRGVTLENTSGAEELPKISLLQIDGDPNNAYGWATFEANLVVSPIPSADLTLTVRYHKREATLVATTDTPLAPINAQWVVVDFAAALAAQRARNYDAADRFLTNYERRLTRLRSSNKDRHHGPKRVRDVSGAWL